MDGKDYRQALRSVSPVAQTLRERRMDELVMAHDPGWRQRRTILRHKRPVVRNQQWLSALAVDRRKRAKDLATRQRWESEVDRRRAAFDITRIEEQLRRMAFTMKSDQIVFENNLERQLRRWMPRLTVPVVILSVSSGYWLARLLEALP